MVNIKLSRTLSLISFLFTFLICSFRSPAQLPVTIKQLENKDFRLRFSARGISSLQKTKDIYPTDYVQRKKPFTGVVIRYQQNNKGMDSLDTFLSPRKISVETTDQIQYITRTNTAPLKLTEKYTLTSAGLIWNITLDNLSSDPVTIKDLEIPISYNNQGGENAKDIFEQHVIKHHSIAGNNSFLFWQRPTGLGPYLLMLPQGETSLEYFSTKGSDENRGQFKTFIHAAYSAAQEIQGTWRQPLSSATIPGKGRKSYGFKLRWAESYTDIRRILVDEGMIDIQVMPGMTVPNDLDVNIALKTNQKNLRVAAEFPQKTTITAMPSAQAGTFLYRIRFARLGENKVIITYGDHRHTLMEFFVTEPLETLYKKRAAFLVNHQQHRDSTKWYNGLFSIYDMKNGILRGPEHADGFDKSRLAYVLASDDPVLGKAPFLAAKNVFYPEQKEIDAIEYYIKNFVWGGLQRTDSEKPNPYGLYGTPDWQLNRDSLKRSQNVNDVNRNKMHIWRSYDYPHIMMLYFELYKIAKRYPGMTHFRDQDGYLEMAKETAKAYFKYPYEILPWYETYKWGCYNELLIVDLIAELEQKGFQKDANEIRAEWEKKVKYFLYDDPYPFRSEYAVDATAYESTHAFAKYAASNKMQPDSNLWYDKNLGKWYSHPSIKADDGRKFMKREIAANIASRGWLETSFYYYGSDFRGKSDSFTLSYMSQMGGGAILDDALHFSEQPAEELRLGYGAYLSSFALINSGTAESNFGYWYPGLANDGASGWAFEPQQQANTWIGKPQGRGPWYYDGEIDLGFGGATRCAATIITEDPVFGMVAYGGNIQKNGPIFSVIPRDGLRARYHYRTKAVKIDLILLQDGFARDKTISFDAKGRSLSFTIENRTGNDHTTALQIKGLQGNYTLQVLGEKDVRLFFVRDEMQTLQLKVNDAFSTVIIAKCME